MKIKYRSAWSHFSLPGSEISAKTIHWTIFSGAEGLFHNYSNCPVDSFTPARHMRNVATQVLKIQSGNIGFCTSIKQWNVFFNSTIKKISFL